MIDENAVNLLYDKIPCRNTQIDQLLRMMGMTSQVAFPNLFVYGHTSSGKTHTVLSILEDSEVLHVYANCVECYSSRVLFELILNGVSRTKLTPQNDYASFAICDNANDFVRHLTAAVKKTDLENKTLYIVLDKAEKLRDLEFNILPVFLRLQELIHIKVCTILISEIVWDKFRVSSGLREPIQLHFPQYTMDEFCTILMRNRPSEYSEGFYANFLKLMLSVLYMACRNLAELKYLAEQNFPKYVEPIRAGQATERDAKKLWKNIEPQLRKSVQSLYLREHMDSDCPTTTTERHALNLPFHSKYLLIAAYLASYNPLKVDKRFFVKMHDKVSKMTKLKSIKRNERVSNHLLGPKPFPLDRLFAIFYSIVDERIVPSALIYSQIASLTSLNLIGQIGREDTLDSPKYKCLMSLDFITTLARSVDFDVMRYLYDFV